MSAVASTQPTIETVVPVEQPSIAVENSDPIEQTIEAHKTNFVPHRDDPFLSMSEAGRLIGRTHTTIRRWIDDGLLDVERDARGLRRIRKSELIRFTGVTAFARKSPFIWVQEAELPDSYQYDEATYPRVRLIDSIQYFPVPLVQETSNGET